jgi:hypothetical protein
VSTLTYDKKGYVTKVVITIDEDSDGSNESTETQSFGTDRRGRTVLSEYVVDGPSGIVTLSYSITYDARGNAVASEQVIDYGSPGLADYRYTSTSTYNSKGQVIAGVDTSFMSPASGTEVYTGGFTYAMTYDSRGNLVASSSDLDSDGTGGADVFVDTSTTYDGSGRPVLQVSTTVDSGDTYVNQAALTYDGSGRLATLDVTQTRNGIPLQLDHVSYTIDGKSRLVRVVSERDYGADGIDTIDTEERGYDSKGRIVSASGTATDGAGHLWSSQRSTVVYTKATVTTTTWFDYNGDGVDDEKVVNSSPA